MGRWQSWGDNSERKDDVFILRQIKGEHGGNRGMARALPLLSLTLGYLVDTIP